MLRYAKVINSETKTCNVGDENGNTEFYKSIGMKKLDVEQGFDGNWYLVGYAPSQSLENLKAEKLAELKANRTAYKKTIQINSDYTYWDCDITNNIYNFNNIMNCICGWTAEERALFIEKTELISSIYDSKKELINNATLETISSINTEF